MISPPLPSPDRESTPDLENKVLAKIDAEHVEPRPRWVYRLRDAGLFVAWTVFIVAGGLTVAAFLFVLANAGWEVSSVTHAGWQFFFAEAVPGLWLMSCVGLLVIASWSARTWRHGYRYSLAVITGGGLLISVMLGGVFFIFGAGQAIDELGGKAIPGYMPALKRQESRWSRPERGLLAGDVLAVSSSESMVRIRELSGGEWSVLIPENVTLITEQRVRFIGRVKDDSVRLFEACAALPWEVYGGSWRPKELFPHPRLEALPRRERKMAQDRITHCRDVRPTLFKLTP